MIKTIFSSLLYISTVFLSVGCQKETVNPVSEEITEQDKDRYVSSKLLTTIPLNMLQSLASSGGFSAYSGQIKYGVSVYKVIYTTSYQGKEITASGLACVPVGLKGPAPVLSAQHGTIFAHSEAPSNFSGLTGFELFAAAGYITLIPDYIGFGEAKNVLHPYYDQKHSALAVVDMIKAGKSFYKEAKVSANEQLFLVGYSEGGYVTLAAQKEIETNLKHNLKVTASAAGAGGYDLTSMLSGIASGQPYSYPAYLAYVLMGYSQTNNWQRPLSEIFQEPYASRLPSLFDGSKGGSSINQGLTTDVKKLFTPAFFSGLQDGNKELALKQALKSNSLLDWTPQSPTKLYHGTADQIVPFSNSKITYEAFKARGTAKVELISIQGGTHGSSIVPMLQSVIPWMQSFQNLP